MGKPQELLDNLADQSAELDEIIERNQESHRQRFLELQLEPTERDPVIWADAHEALIAPILSMEFEDWFLLDAQDFASMDDDPAKAILWQAQVAASKAQADVEVLRQLIDVSEQHSKENDRLSADLSGADLREAAAEGIGNDRFKTAQERRSNGS